VAVVTTGVHASAMARGMRNLVLFFDVQRVHIGAKRDRTIARQRAFERADHASPGNTAIDGNAKRFEEAGDQFRRLVLFERGLGMRVDLVTPLRHLGMKLGNPIDNRHDPQPSQIAPWRLTSRGLPCQQHPDCASGREGTFPVIVTA